MSEEDKKLIWTTAYLIIIASLCHLMEDKVNAMWLMFLALGCWLMIIRMNASVIKFSIEEEEEPILEGKKE